MTQLSTVTSPVSLSLAIAAGYLLLLVWQLTLKLRVIRHFRRPLPQLIHNEAAPLALVVLCLRGGDPFLKHSLKLLLQQDYPRYRVRIVVDSPTDEAHGILREVWGESLPTHVEVMNLTHRYPFCTLKISGFLLATESLPEATEIVAIMDGDAVPHSTWLRELATPIVRGEAGVTTGIRWYAPHRSTLGSLCRFWWGTAAMPIVMWFQIPWGGTMALRSDMIQSEELRFRLKHAFAEDITAGMYALDQGEQIKYPPTLAIVNREVTNLPDFFRFNVRQLLVGRTARTCWVPLVIHNVLSCLPLTYPLWRLCGLPVSAMTDAAFVGYCLVIWACEVALGMTIRALLATRGETITGWNEIGRWFDSLLAIMVLPYLQLMAVLQAATLHSVRWRGVWYRIGGEPPVLLSRDERAETVVVR